VIVVPCSCREDGVVGWLWWGVMRRGIGGGKFCDWNWYGEKNWEREGTLDDVSGGSTKIESDLDGVRKIGDAGKLVVPDETADKFCELDKIEEFRPFCSVCINRFQHRTQRVFQEGSQASITLGQSWQVRLFRVQLSTKVGFGVIVVPCSCREDGVVGWLWWGVMRRGIGGGKFCDWNWYGEKNWEREGTLDDVSGGSTKIESDLDGVRKIGDAGKLVVPDETADKFCELDKIEEESCFALSTLIFFASASSSLSVILFKFSCIIS